jgi:hypothetical protein
MNSVTVDAARNWFGYGRWRAPYWFVGMEPGGTEAASSYQSWKRLGGGELIDCKHHHLDSNFDRWHGEDQRGTQPTWRRLIQTMLAFEGLGATLDDVLRYQHAGWGCEDDDTALIELGALHAPSLASEVDRVEYRDERIALVRERLLEHEPVFALFYGLTYREEYERVIGVQFGGEGFAWRGSTLCALTPHPTSHLYGKPTPWSDGEWWIALGKRMSDMIAKRQNAKT